MSTPPEYIAEQHRQFVAAYRQAEADTEASVWADRPDAINRIKVFNAEPAKQD